MPEAAVPPIDPVAAANVDEYIDYRIAQRTKSAEGWRSFLTAHPNGPHAQLARAELDRLGSPETPPQQPIAAQATNAAAPDSKALPNESLATAKPEAGKSPIDSVTAANVDEDQSARAELDKPGSPEPPHEQPTAAPDSKAPGEAASPDRPSPPSEAATATTDEICKNDEDRLQRLSNGPTIDDAMRFATKLRCETLRPELFRLTERLDYQDPGAGAARRPATEPRNRTRLRSLRTILTRGEMRGAGPPACLRSFWRCSATRRSTRRRPDEPELAAAALEAQAAAASAAPPRPAALLVEWPVRPAARAAAEAVGPAAADPAVAAADPAVAAAAARVAVEAAARVAVEAAARVAAEATARVAAEAVDPAAVAGADQAAAIDPDFAGVVRA
jgi:hypothetical protein